MERESSLKDKERDREEAEAAAMAASRYLLKLYRIAEEEETKRKMYEEVEMRTKRYFDRNGDRTGAVYCGDFVELGDDWLPHGYGEFRLASGETIYEGCFDKGKRGCGEGTIALPNGDRWRGPFVDDEPRGLGTLTESSSSSSSKEGKAIFHGFATRAWLDELVPGRRLRVLGKDATIVAAADLRRPAVFRVHFDDHTACIVDLAQEPFIILFHQPLFHKIVDDSCRSRTSPAPCVANIFRPQDDVENDVVEKKKMETVRKEWEQRLASKKAAQQRLSARSELESAMKDQREQAAAEAVEMAASETAVAEEMARRKAARKFLKR